MGIAQEIFPFIYFWEFTYAFGIWGCFYVFTKSSTEGQRQRQKGEGKNLNATVHRLKTKQIKSEEELYKR